MTQKTINIMIGVSLVSIAGYITYEAIKKNSAKKEASNVEAVITEELDKIIEPSKEQVELKERRVNLG